MRWRIWNGVWGIVSGEGDGDREATVRMKLVPPPSTAARIGVALVDFVMVMSAFLRFEFCAYLLLLVITVLSYSPLALRYKV